MTEPGLGNQKYGADDEESEEPCAIMPGQRYDHDSSCEQRQAQEGHRTEGCFEKEKTQVLGVGDAVNVACHIDQKAADPGNSGKRRDWRGDAQQNNGRVKGPGQSARTGREPFVSHVEPVSYTHLTL